MHAKGHACNQRSTTNIECFHLSLFAIIRLFFLSTLAVYCRQIAL